MGTIVTREAQPAELRLVAQHYLGMRRELGWPDGELDPQFVSLFAATYDESAMAGDSRYIVAEVDSGIVGSAVAMRRRTMSERYLKSLPTGYIANVYVDPSFRRQGIARALTAAAIDWLRSIGCEVVRLQASRYGRPLYESMGFVSTGEMELRL
jgi:GNAT superfamily N-acetyltransferase